MNENTCAFKITFDYFLCVNAKKKMCNIQGSQIQKPPRAKQI